MIGKYESTDAKTFKLYLLDLKVIGKAVEAGQLSGKVKSGRQANTVSITLSEKPEKILKYLEKHGETCFMKEPVIYERVKTET